jgi:hypothetical protein
MSGIAELTPSMLDRIRGDLVGLKMPRATPRLGANWRLGGVTANEMHEDGQRYNDGRPLVRTHPRQVNQGPVSRPGKRIMQAPKNVPLRSSHSQERIEDADGVVHAAKQDCPMRLDYAIVRAAFLDIAGRASGLRLTQDVGERPAMPGIGPSPPRSGP